jgi:hypothetical protein
MDRLKFCLSTEVIYLMKRSSPQGDEDDSSDSESIISLDLIKLEISEDNRSVIKQTSYAELMSKEALIDIIQPKTKRLLPGTIQVKSTFPTILSFMADSALILGNDTLKDSQNVSYSRYRLILLRLEEDHVRFCSEYSSEVFQDNSSQAEDVRCITVRNKMFILFLSIEHEKCKVVAVRGNKLVACGRKQKIKLRLPPWVKKSYMPGSISNDEKKNKLQMVWYSSELDEKKPQVYVVEMKLKL